MDAYLNALREEGTREDLLRALERCMDKYRSDWTAVEAAIRADERAKVIEECAAHAEKKGDYCDICYDGEGASACFGVARELRAKIVTEHV